MQNLMVERRESLIFFYAAKAFQFLNLSIIQNMLHMMMYVNIRYLSKVGS